MMPEKCPACGGYCCEDHARRWRPSLRYVHGWPHEHTCPDCSDGYAPVLTALPLPVADVVAEERAAVIAWLRDVAETMNHNGDKCCGRVEDLAEAIERGEHRRKEE